MRSIIHSQVRCGQRNLRQYFADWLARSTCRFSSSGAASTIAVGFAFVAIGIGVACGWAEAPSYNGIGNNAFPTKANRTSSQVLLRKQAGRPTNPVGGEIWVNPKDGAKMVYIPGGPFLMGDDDISNNKRHTVTLSGYWFYKNVVTVAMYKHYCKDAGEAMPDAPSFNPNWSKGDHPMVNVNWSDAVAYCTWAQVTLPSEAQWERAARGTNGRKYAWGDTYDHAQVWASTNDLGDAGGTSAVGKYGLGEYGCSDMGGNVWQWCLDWYSEKYWDRPAATRPDPVNTVNSGFGREMRRVRRGESWIATSHGNFRAAHRYSVEPKYGEFGGGFRGAAGP